jgi:hypothetical protein
MAGQVTADSDCDAYAATALATMGSWDGAAEESANTDTTRLIVLC